MNLGIEDRIILLDNTDVENEIWVGVNINRKVPISLVIPPMACEYEVKSRISLIEKTIEKTKLDDGIWSEVELVPYRIPTLNPSNGTNITERTKKLDNLSLFPNKNASEIEELRKEIDLVRRAEHFLTHKEVFTTKILIEYFHKLHMKKLYSGKHNKDYNERYLACKRKPAVSGDVMETVSNLITWSLYKNVRKMITNVKLHTD